MDVTQSTGAANFTTNCAMERFGHSVHTCRVKTIGAIFVFRTIPLNRTLFGVILLLQGIVLTQSADSTSSTTAVPVNYQSANNETHQNLYSPHELDSTAAAAALTTINRGSISSTVAPKIQRKRANPGGKVRFVVSIVSRDNWNEIIE